MLIAIVECTADLIILTRFTKKNDGIILQHQVQKQLHCGLEDWIQCASVVIKQWVDEMSIPFPITILLPDFALLTKNIKVPKVSSGKQKYVIQSHIAQSLGLDGDENIQFVVRSTDESELDVICSIIKNDWLNSFCKAIASIGDKIISIEPAIIHYYNAFNLLFPLTIKNILFIIFHGKSLSCLFIGQNNLLIFKLQLSDNDLNLSIKELLQFHNNKYPDTIPEEMLIAGMQVNEENKKVLHSLSNFIGLPIRIFSPLGNEHTHRLGSIGFAYAYLLGDGLFFDLTPTATRRNWKLHCSKKAFLVTGVSLLMASCLVWIGLVQQEKRYLEKIEIYQNKIEPLRRNASIIARNEKEISFYEEGFSSLQNQMQSSYSWINFLNSLQSILVSTPKVHIHSLKITQDDRMELKDYWKSKMLDTQVIELQSLGYRTLSINGILHIENPNQTSRETIADIKYLINELSKLDFIQETKNLSFDVKTIPDVPFSIAFALKPQAL